MKLTAKGGLLIGLSGRWLKFWPMAATDPKQSMPS